MPEQESPLPKLDTLVTAIHNTVQNKLNEKAAQNDLTAHVNDTNVHISPSDRIILDDSMSATAAANSFASKEDFTNHVDNTDIHVTAEKVVAWNSKAEGEHTHSISEIHNLTDTLNNLQTRSLSKYELESILVWN